MIQTNVAFVTSIIITVKHTAGFINKQFPSFVFINIVTKNVNSH